MYKHHAESIENMIQHYQENKSIRALFLIGSVATGTERPDSDLDGVAVVTPRYYKQRKNEGTLEEVCHGKCTYERGYFNVHYMTRAEMEKLAENGAEPMRNMFSCARPLFCHEPDLPALAARIPVFQKGEADAKQFRFCCTLKMFYSYYLVVCKPEGFMRLHVADGMLYNLYRLILLENEILFPSMRKLESYVRRAFRKPERIMEKAARFMQTLSDEDALALVESFEKWTAYDYPKDHNTVMNNFADPYEWS